MGSKSKTTSSNTNSYGSIAPTDTADVIALRKQIDSAYDTPDPTIPYSFARRREAVANRFGSPFGADYSPEVREASKYNDLNELDQEQGMANRMDTFNRRNAKTQAMSGLANQTGSRIVQTGGQGSSTQYTPFNYGNLISAGAQVGSAFI